MGTQDLIIANGFLWGDATTASAAENPDQAYAIIDSVVEVPDSPADTVEPAPNVRSMVFAENEGSALVGAAAACASKTGKIGFIGGVEHDLIKKFEAGYIAGAEAVNPDIEVVTQYITQPPDFTGFNDPAKGKAIATQMIGDDVDVIFAAAGGSGKGMFEAAVESGKEPGELYVIGIDSDQYLSASAAEQPYILTSMLKRVELAVYQAIAAQLNGELTGEVFDVRPRERWHRLLGFEQGHQAVRRHPRGGQAEDPRRRARGARRTLTVDVCVNPSRVPVLMGRHPRRVAARILRARRPSHRLEHR